eukprot:TRINITY_DN58969_c0_g1_i1.p2 TRINITY_DN58969_c0_g1~~TRINITY_DN58969_c0_g1_i1.p2  ORF type:complete len:247 (-),score=59.54 TRINITY_DN58969_c0_g1_i1:26-766(-)
MAIPDDAKRRCTWNEDAAPGGAGADGSLFCQRANAGGGVVLQRRVEWCIRNAALMRDFHAERLARGVASAAGSCEAKHVTLEEVPEVELALLLYPLGLRATPDSSGSASAATASGEPYVSFAVHAAGTGMAYADLAMRLEMWPLVETSMASEVPAASLETRLGGLAPGGRRARACCDAAWSAFGAAADSLRCVAEILVLRRPEPAVLQLETTWQPTSGAASKSARNAGDDDSFEPERLDGDSDSDW